MSVSITTSTIAELGVLGWRYTKLIAQNGHNPAQLVDFLNALNTRALSLINAAYDIVDISVTDNEYAGISEWLAGESGLAEGDLARIITLTVADLADNALAVEKTSAVANGDLYEIDGADSVDYLANGPQVAIAMVDDEYAGVSEFIAGESSIAEGTIFQIAGSTTEDLTDNALATAKTSAVAVKDIYIIDGADSVAYLGNGDIIEISVTDNEYAGVSEWIAGESALAVNDFARIVTLTAADVTDNAMTTAKNDGAIVVGDLFLISGADAVTFQGNGSGVTVQADIDSAYALSSSILSQDQFTTLATHI